MCCCWACGFKFLNVSVTGNLFCENRLVVKMFCHLRLFFISALLFSPDLPAQDSLFGGRAYEFNARRYGFMLEGAPGLRNGFGMGAFVQQYRWRLGYRVMPGIQFLSQRRDVVAANLPVVVESTFLNLPVSGLSRTNPSRGWWFYFPAGAQYTYDLSSKQSRFGVHGGIGFTRVLQYFELGAEVRGQYVMFETDLPMWEWDKRSVFISLIFAG
jgi:hypothetical protein